VRIGFDAIRALHNTTGLGNYSRNLLRGLHAAAPQHELHLYTPRPPVPAFRDLPAELQASLHLPSPESRVPRLLPWRTFRLGRDAQHDGVALYHGLSHEIPRDLPATKIRSVVTFADLIFEKRPDFFPYFDRVSYRWRYRWSARNADAVVAISGETRDDLIRLYGIDPARITVVPPARDPRFSQPVSDVDRERARARYGLPSEYIVSVGTFEARKNQMVLLHALKRLAPADSLPLVLVGRDGGALELLDPMSRARRLKGRVFLRTNVTADDLPAVVQGATLFLYPSLSEGFGMPIVEALSAGVPAIVSSGGCLVEAGGPATRYVAARDVDGWAAAISELTSASDLRDTMRTTGRHHAELFNGHRVAARLLSVYDAVMTKTALP
jgi:glycosyltransferase involved in cell wall biosynthesis